MNEILQFFGYFNFGNNNSGNNNSTENNKGLPLFDAKKQENSRVEDAKRKQLNKAELLAERKRMIG